MICSALLLACERRTTKVDSVVQVEELPIVILNEENFPDFNFRSAICRLLPIAEGDTIPNKMLMQVEELRLSELGISSLKGVEFFTSLRQLDCSHNQLKEIDVTKNVALTTLECRYNQLSAIDVTHNSHLRSLGCSHNQLKNIDVSKNPQLMYLICNDNKIEKIDVSKNPQLCELGVVNCELKVLNVSNNLDLRELYCTGNHLRELDLRSNEKMENLYCEQPLWHSIKILRPANNPDLGKGNEHTWSDGITFIWLKNK